MSQRQYYNASALGDYQRSDRYRPQRAISSVQAPVVNRLVDTMSKIFIENLPSTINAPALRKRFEAFGELDDVSILVSATGIAGQHIGVCKYIYEDDAQAAFRGMNGKLYDGQTLRILLVAAQDDYSFVVSRRGSDIADLTDNAVSLEGQEAQDRQQDLARNQVCDYQDMTTGNVCGEQFSTLSGLQQHWLSHSWGYRSLKCERDPSCVFNKRGFVTENERERHYNTLHLSKDNRPFKCTVSSCHYHRKGFPTQNALLLHQNFHSLDYEEYPCLVAGCPYESHQKQDTMLHMEEIHGILEDTITHRGASGRDQQSQSLRPGQRRFRRGAAVEPRLHRNKNTLLDEKVPQQYPQFPSAEEEKASILRSYIGAQENDYRPFKCSIPGCKFVREGFETQSELSSHISKEHASQRSVISSNASAVLLSADLMSTPILRLQGNSTGFGTESSSSDQLPTSGPYFLQCNNVDCSLPFALEQDWRKHSITCKIASVMKQCSFVDCQAKFASTPALSSHEYQSHGIRICSSLTCNRAFHQLEDAESHMRDLHSNLYSEGRRPRLAFIASVPAWNQEIADSGFPYDPYRCALLNISQEKFSIMNNTLPRQVSIKGKEVARSTIEQTYVRESEIGQKPVSEDLPRYSMIMGTSARPRSPVLLTNKDLPIGLNLIPQKSQPDDAIIGSPASKPALPLSTLSKSFSIEGQSSILTSKGADTSSNNKNPRYRYGSDGSRFVTGAVVLSPDKHQVLVLRSRDEFEQDTYELPSGFFEVDDQSMEASALRQSWQTAGIVGRILRAIEPAPAEEPDENGLADWHSYFEVEIESEKIRWPKSQSWERRWFTYREARVALSSQPDLIRALERSTIFKRGSSSSLNHEDTTLPSVPSYPVKTGTQIRAGRTTTQVRPRRRTPVEERPLTTRKYNTVSPATDNIMAWRRDILPWLRRNFSTVMGKNKHGAIELLRVRNKPTICITCSDPKELELDSFVEVVSDLFPLHIKVGILARSARAHSPDMPISDKIDPNWVTEDEPNESSNPQEHLIAKPSKAHHIAGTSGNSYLEIDNYNDTSESENDIEETPETIEKAFRLPPVYGRYLTRPSCGSTIGISSNENGAISAGTFGGVVILVKPDGSEAPYGLISHHVIEEKTEDTEMGAGVDEGWLINSTGAHRFPVQQPARMDLEEAKDSLEMQRYYCDREKRYCDVDDGRAVRAKYAVLNGLDHQSLDFGYIAYSSGYGFDANRHQMDWALIGDIPSWRLQDNIVPGVENFYDLHYDGSPKAPYPVEKTFFNFISETFEEEHSLDLSEIDPLRRIHGVGSYSGIMDGIVSSETAFFRLDGMDSEEWFFTPRYCGGLGVKGDSGTWIFDDFGKVVGQIIAYNYRTDTAYFTRMDYLFEHIKSKTKALEVYIPYKGELAKWRSDEMPKPGESTRSGSVTDASSSYVDSAFGTVQTNDTELTSPSILSDSGLGWANFPKQT